MYMRPIFDNYTRICDAKPNPGLLLAPETARRVSPVKKTREFFPPKK
jgi:hypothetical protein